MHDMKAHKATLSYAIYIYVRLDKTHTMIVFSYTCTNNFIHTRTNKYKCNWMQNELKIESSVKSFLHINKIFVIVIGISNIFCLQQQKHTKIKLKYLQKKKRKLRHKDKLMLHSRSKRNNYKWETTNWNIWIVRAKKCKSI